MTFQVALLAGLVAYIALAWLATTFFKLTGLDLWVVRGFLILLGAAAAGAIWWWQRRRKKAGETGDAAAQAGDEIDLLIRDADARLTGTNLGKLGNLPVILLAGPPGSAKTNTLAHSGLEPELMAGQVYQDNAIVPTRSCNLWFARQIVFVDSGGAVLHDPARWMRLVKRLAPRKLSAALGGKGRAPRAAVVCFDVEDFLKPGASESIPIAVRNLHARLGDISQTHGISFPVYVVFTKCDRVPFFLDYVRNVSNEEAGQVLGVTLSIETGQPAGVYAERAAQRLSVAFDDLFYSLADKRAEFLGRENAADKLPGVYEFPREFRKLRAMLVQFLVDLSKPSQLSAAPFLRGFYFSGVRPVVVTEMSQPAAPRPAEKPAFGPSAGATGLFRAGQPRAPEMQQPQAVGTRRVPQWLFLSHFWNDIVLADRAAIMASGASLKTSAARRLLFACLAGLCLLYSIALVVSYARNKALEGRVLEAASGLAALPAGGQDLPSADALRRLDALRQELVTLSSYQRDGAPLSLRWGLYSGGDVYPEAYRLYFGRFHDVLFGSTQASLVDTLRRLPAAPAPTDVYGPPYNSLKAYLITTSEWKHSTRAFLSPYLLNRWSEGRGVDAERTELARRQFDFYSEELQYRNPFSTDNEAPSVARAREYLKKFNAEERIYQALVEEASRRTPAVNFNRLFPNQAVYDAREVRGAFTKDGWAFMQAAFRKPDQLFGGEDWVLGPQTFANLDRAQLEQHLRGFYYRDFVQEWRDYLKAANVARYASLTDAAAKLGLISGSQSPLLALLCLASQHTNVDAPEIKTAFQAVQAVVPPACQAQYVAPSNQQYMAGLLKLQNSVQQVASSPAGARDPVAAQATIAQAAEARLTTGQIAQTFAIDTAGNVPATVKKLMEDPITNAEALLKGIGPGELRAKGQALCAQFRVLMAKYPFNLKSTTQATLDDVSRFFRPPDGALWQFYSQSLQPLIDKQGSQYVPKAGAMAVTPGFLSFFNRAAAFSDAAYPSGAQQPRLAYTLRSDLSGTNQSIALTLDGQNFSNSSGKSASKQFVWPGSSSGATLQVKFGGEGFNWPRYDGLWAAFEFFGDAEERNGHLEWTLKTGQSSRQVTTATGQPVLVRFDLDMTPPVFRKGYFSNLSCVAEVAR